MYLRSVHAESDIPSLRHFITDNPLGLLITSLKSDTFPTIQCSHIPWVINVTNEADEKELGKLRGHMAKQNPHSKALSAAVQGSYGDSNQLTEEVSVMFNGPVHHYVTPRFYTETKPSTGKVVPTWNYSAVQVYGKATIFFDSKSAETGEFLQKQISDLSTHAETTIMGYQRPWGVSDAPDRYIDLLKKNIIGIEIEITRLEGKYKMSQEIGVGDRQGVVQGFKALQSEAGDKMARTVHDRGESRQRVHIV